MRTHQTLTSSLPWPEGIAASAITTTETAVVPAIKQSAQWPWMINKQHHEHAQLHWQGFLWLAQHVRAW